MSTRPGLRPKALQPGDTIGIVSPSWGGPATFPHRVQLGVQALENLGYRVRMAPHATGSRGHVSGTAKERVRDIHDLFEDPEVRAVMASIGGNHSCHLLPHLDWDLLKANPKILIGFSDMTVLNVAVHARTGLITFNGPALMTDLGEYPSPLPYTVHWMEKILTQAQPAGALAPSETWTEEFLDWETGADQVRPRTLRPSPGWSWIKPGMGEGRLIGGCVESLEHLRGTPYWPDLEAAILFWETSEGAPSLEWMDACLQDYDNMGVLSRLSALVVGRPMKYSDREKELLRQTILEKTAKYAFPILTDVDFGHTSPQLTLPIGCMARVDSEEKSFSLLESAVER